ncbi:outer membrane protein assembly factor BamA [Ideonella sp. DXS29W]|uniref:Outer membrane protein assembly factor BamA n=1 Tax=Ideonella lacteola TaxID=2984193 RepID=A0ABU9BZN1_9BURK
MPFPLALTSLRPVPAYVALVAAATVATSAQAVEPFKISDIRIEGLQRGDPGSVFGALPFRIGDEYNDDKGAAALRALFATGLFKDVRVDIEGQVVVVVVEERSVIASVNFIGLREFDKDTLAKALKENGISEGQPYDKAVIDRAEQEIKRQYLTRSLYGAEVVTTATPIERNRVNITFTVVEGDVAKIKDIRIEGAKAFSESTLLDLMDLTTGGWLSWYTKSDRYSRAKLNADLEKIRAYYLNKGYLEFDVKTTQVTISPDKQEISILIGIEEGQPYTVTGVKLEGQYLGREEDFKQRITITPGEPYRGDEVTATTRAFSDLYGTYGYAFARIEPRQDIDRKTGQVVIVLQGSPGQRVNVRRVNIAGNTITRDEVLRREFRQFESAWYDSAKIKLSRDRVERLGYFEEVTVDTQEVPGSPDQVDLVLNVKEKQTGSLQLAAGYSTAGLSFSGSIKKENVFGTGNYLGLEVNTSKLSRNLVVSTVDPYFTDDGVSRALDLYYRTSKPLNSQGDAYQLATPGAAVRFGVPFTEYDTVFFGVGLEQTIIGTSSGVPNSYFKFVETFGNHALSVPLTVGWAREERDNPLTPTKGRYQRLNLDFSVAGDVHYARLNAQYQQYFSITNKLTLGVNGEVGAGYGLNGKPYPVFKNFYGGGLGSVRVFESGSFGGVDLTGAYDGGSKKMNLNSELYFPVPGSGNDKSLRIFAFADAGNVWRDHDGAVTQDDRDRGQTGTLSDLRASVGLGLSWISPVGPLKLSYGTPMRSFRGDKIQRFQFQVGTAF